MTTTIEPDKPTTEYSHAFWQAALAGKRVEDTKNQAPLGFYRKQDSSGRRIGVAVYIDEATGRPVLRVGKGKPRLLVTKEDEEDACLNTISWVTKDPVSYDAYMTWFNSDDGRWPDDPPPIERRNFPDDPYEALKLEIAAEREALEAWLKTDPIRNEEADARAEAWIKRIADLEKRAEEFRVAEKKPHDDAAKAVQARWKPLTDEAKGLKDRLRAAATPYRQERAKRLVQEAAEKVETTGVARPPRKVKTGLRTVKSAEFTDYPAFVAAVKDWPNVVEFMTGLADQIARATVPQPVPGMKIVETQTAR